MTPFASATLTISGNISQTGPSGLTLNGPGTLVLSGSNSYTGGTTITAGTLSIGNGGAGEFLASPTIANSGLLIFSHSDRPDLLGGYRRQR